MAIDPKTGRRGTGDRESMGMADNYVSVILPMADDRPLIGLYIGGVIKPNVELKLTKSGQTRAGRTLYSVAQSDFPPLPSAVRPPTAEELRTMYYKLKAIKPEKTPPKIVALNDDWRTKGNYLDRYGRSMAVLCAQGGGGFDYTTGYQNDIMSFQFKPAIGHNYREKDDLVRYWVHWLESTDIRVLQCLHLGGRKQAEWDDHKEEYPLTLDGPHLYAVFQVVPAKYVMSMYFFNKDGHQGHNRIRDYSLTVKTVPQPPNFFADRQRLSVLLEPVFLRAPAGASSRVCDFWGGTYKRFLIDVKQDECVIVQVNANYSFNTIISGVFFDIVGELDSKVILGPPRPPREPTAWEDRLTNPEGTWWWGINSLDRVLCFLEQNPSWFHLSARRHVLSLIRLFVKFDGDNVSAPSDLDANDKKLIKADVARILHLVQLYETGDLVDFTKTKYQLYRWNARSRMDRKTSPLHRWSDDEFQDFTNQGIQKETW